MWPQRNDGTRAKRMSRRLVIRAACFLAVSVPIVAWSFLRGGTQGGLPERKRYAGGDGFRPRFLAAVTGPPANLEAYRADPAGYCEAQKACARRRVVSQLARDANALFGHVHCCIIIPPTN